VEGRKFRFRLLRTPSPARVFLFTFSEYPTVQVGVFVAGEETSFPESLQGKGKQAQMNFWMIDEVSMRGAAEDGNCDPEEEPTRAS